MNSSATDDQVPSKDFQVVARKYRPKSFEALIGQDHIARALSNAIHQNRIGHAYLFTGARGVGKTSSARIFAKCLNCVQGPTTKPCNRCDICESISSGEDVDVLEIDGASNRGIDEIRSLRSNVAIRPSRSRFKIYIIDEVHMLTMQAFNALLKTLEEPPPHVKFIFCTTDPHKMPITVLSRCQRFDFSPVQVSQIADSLKDIVEKEGKTADDDALNLLARRANGSMRDSQSLLEQIFSFCGSHLSIDEVHRLLGTADMGRVAQLSAAMIAHDPTTSLNLVHQAVSEGIDPGQLVGQLLGFYRDIVTVKLNCSVDTLLVCSPSDQPTLLELASSLGMETLLAIMQILDSAMVKMQSSLHSRTLLEMAVIRICNLENLDAISDLVKRLAESGQTKSTLKPGPIPAVSPASADSQPASVSKKKEIAEPPTEEISRQKTAQPKTDGGKCDLKARADQQHSGQPDPMLSRLATEGESLVAQMTGMVNEREVLGTRPTGAAVPTTPANHLRSSSTEHRSGFESDSEFDPESDLACEPECEPESDWESELESDPDMEFEELSEDPESSPVPPAVHLAVFDLVQPEALRKHWAELVDRLQGMTADMVRDPEELELLEENLVRVTLRDTYTVRECLKSERKQNIEAVFSDVCKQVMRVDFKPSAEALRKLESAPPQLSRARQLRILVERDFVRQVMETFSAEVKDFYHPKPK
jgi:DNA polymerase-3 subunit gamma/tau